MIFLVFQGNAIMNRTLSLIILGLSLAGCAEFTKVGSQIAVSAGVLSSSQADSLQRTSEALGKASQDLKPEQEYYLGRAVSASLLSKYPAASKKVQENRYLNLVGKTLVLASDKANQYASYHFMLLDSEEVNAFAAPSGFIFVTKGMLRLCQNEDDLAAVLAHEISHVQNGHAVKSIKASRYTSLATIMASEAAKTAANTYSPVQLGELTKVLESSVDDVTQNLTNSGYGRSLETEADKTALTLLKKAGYNAEGLLRVLERLKAKSDTTKGGFFATHPDTDDRISDVKDLLGEEKVNSVSVVRTNRFSKIMGRL